MIRFVPLPGEVHAVGGQPTVHVIAMPGQALNRRDGARHCLHSDVRTQQAESNSVHEFVDIG